MAIELEDRPHTPSTPVVKRQALGEKFVGAVVKVEQRDLTKMIDGVRKPVLKANGKARQELVVHCLVMPKSACSVGIGDDTHPAVEGERVRLILKGKAFADWLTARKEHRGGRILVGDVVVQTVTHAQQYDANGTPKGGEITDPATVAAVPRGTSLGFYGPISLHEPKEQTWVDAAEKAYNDLTAIDADGGDTASYGDDEPF